MVGQETDNAGLFHAIATERCQSLDMLTVPMLKADSQYRGLKETGCNSLGVAADEANLGNGHDYTSYQKRLGNMPVGADVNNGHKIIYPLVSRSQFEHLGN